MNNKWKYSVSIIVPVYNTERYIFDSIQSIINQEFSNYEVIIVNDGSTDNSVDIAEKCLMQQPIAYKIIHQSNKGLSAARNAGIRESEGEYICFIDSDDIIEKTHIQSLYTLAQKNDLPVVHCNFEIVTEKKKSDFVRESNAAEIVSIDNAIKYAARRKPAIIVCAFLIKKEFVDEHNLWFNEKLRFGEDSDYIWKTLFKCKKMGCTNESTYKYCQRSDSIMHSISIDSANTYITEFSKTIHLIKQYEGVNRQTVNTVYFREILGFLHAYVYCATKEQFYHVLSRVDIKLLFKYLIKFPDLRIRVLSMILRFAPGLFYLGFNLFKNR